MNSIEIIIPKNQVSLNHLITLWNTEGEIVAEIDLMPECNIGEEAEGVGDS